MFADLSSGLGPQLFFFSPFCAFLRSRLLIQMLARLGYTRFITMSDDIRVDLPDRLKLPESLEKLVDREVETHGPSFGPYFANHSVHGIVSLYSIGGT